MKKKEWKGQYKKQQELTAFYQERYNTLVDEFYSARKEIENLEGEVGELEATLHRLTQQRNNPE